MNPPGSTYSRIQGMAGDVQVGRGLFDGLNHACLWKGTPESFVDMHPSVAYDSGLNDTTGRYHAGYITHGGLGQAGLWIGDDPESFIDLHAMLGPDRYFSVAYGIAEHNGKPHVVGRAGHVNGISRAVAWIARIPETDRPPRRPPAMIPGQQQKPQSASPLVP